MQCPKCASTHTRKNGKQRCKQNYICVQCNRQFIESYEPKGYSEDVKRECLEMYVNGSGFRAIERLHRKTFCYSKSAEMLKLSIRLVIYYLKYGSVPARALCARKLEAIA